MVARAASRLHPAVLLCCVTAASVAVGSVLAEDEWELAAPAPVVAMRPAAFAALDEISCTECHAAIVEQWARTAHAVSWLDEPYQARIAERRRPELCHSCHVPLPILGASGVSRPRARADHRDQGVTCVSCHLAPDGALLGPHGAPTEAHPTRRSDVFAEDRSNVLCASCHRISIGPVVGIAKDFEQAGLAAKGQSCVACHMAPLAGKGSARSHELQTPRDPTFVRRAFHVSLRGDADGVEVVIANRAGHRVPGLEGRRFVFRAELIDAKGAVSDVGEIAFDVRHPIPIGGAAEIRLEGAGISVKLTGLHEDPREERAMLFLEETLRRD